MIEIEKRILLNTKQTAKFLQFLKSNAKFVRDFNRFTLVEVERSDFKASPDSLIDIKIRTTRKGGKLALKYGNWHASSSREEYEVDFELDDIVNLVNIVRVLGYNYFVIIYVHRYEYRYKDFNIVLDKYFSIDRNLVEIEIVLKDRKNLKKSETKIDEFLNEQNMTALTSKEMIGLIQKLNDIKAMRVDFTKTTVEKWFNKWKDWIYCRK